MLFVRLLLLYPLLIDGVKRGRLTVYVANSECSGYPSSSLLLDAWGYTSSVRVEHRVRAAGHGRRELPKSSQGRCGLIDAALTPVIQTGVREWLCPH